MTLHINKEELLDEVFSQDVYTVEALKEILKELIDPRELKQLFKHRSQFMGRKIYLKQLHTPAEVYPLVGVCLEATHDPTLVTDEKRLETLWTHLQSLANQRSLNIKG
jgi:hypothetical protein